MKRILKYVILALLPLMCNECRQIPENPNTPHAYINFTIYPNTIRYQELNVVSGWMYLTSEVESTSRGIIVYRLTQDDFLAYDRLPPNYPNACTDSQGHTTRLVFDSLFVVDHCNNAYYNILNGEIIINEEFDMVPSFVGDEYIYPLIQYHTSYDGVQLRIYN